MQRRKTLAFGAAVVAGVVAAGVAYLLYLRPQWRRQVVEVGRQLLNAADGILRHAGTELAADDERA